MKKFKGIFREKIILSFVMCILLVVVLVSATTAWYASSKAASAYGMKLETDGIGGIKVALEPGGEDIMLLEEKTEQGVPIIPIKLTDLNNVKEKMIAPGSYGPMTFYITALGNNVTEYSMKVKLVYEEEPGAKNRLTKQQRAKIEELMNQHITVYTKKEIVSAEGNEGRWGKFSEPLEYYTDDEATDGTALTGPLVFQEEVKAELYWVWNYEYTDIPGNETAGSEQELKQKIRQYDEEDTMLGNYIDNISFHVYITGKTAEESK